jgi:3-oxoadipate enol-lactonase
VVPTARVNDIDIYYELHGAGAPHVLIPGMGADVEIFKDFIALLATDRQVLAFDPRGAGRTDKPDTPYSMEMMADDTAGLMEATRMPPAHVLGVSMGGRIAIELALRHPGRVRSLILISTSARTPRTLGKTRRRYAVDLLLSLPVVRALAPQRHDPHFRQREASRGYDRSDRLHRIEVPTLILHARHDSVVSHALARKTAAGIKGSSMATFAGGHLFFLASAQTEVLKAIRAFVDSSSSG